MKPLPIEPIGSVRGGRNAMTDDGWGSIRAAIELDVERFTPESVEGLDAVNGSPVLDLKPYMRGFEPRGDVREPEWAREIFKKYW
jgi:tRNA (Thr-GGU) A37 N-methylase